MCSRLFSRRGLLLIPAVLLLAGGCTSRSVLDERFGFDLPAPTEHRLLTNAEGDNKSRRKAWIRERHRAHPDVDTDAVELKNGLAQIRKRNRLAGMEAAGSSRWTERGSNNQAGRMHVASLAPDGQKLYAGSSKGGVWRGNPDGTGWEPLGDNLFGGAHWLVVVPGATPADPDVMIAATDGGVVHRSTDDGATWTVPAGLPTDMAGVRRLVVTADGSHTVFMVARFWDGGQLKNNVLRSTDGGASFHFSNGMATWEGDVWVPRDGGGPIYTLKLGKLQVSNDNGTSWTDLAELPIVGDGGELAGSEAGAPRFWAIIHNGSARNLYRSDDAGASWTFITAVTDYWESMSASIIDPDVFAWGGVEVHRTFDGGDSFAIVNGWGEYYGNPAGKLHADIPGIDVVPGGPGGEIWYISTDGGLFRSLDRLQSVENLSLDGLRVSQYYSTLTSTANPDHVVAGAQDQGYQRADTAAPGPLQFDQLISGDYGHLTSRDGSHNYVYSTYPGFILIHVGEESANLYMEDFPPGVNHSWMPAVTADAWSGARFFFCASKLYRYEKTVGQNDWTHTQWSSQDFSISGGEYLTEMVFSPVDGSRAYAVTNVGRLWWSDDHGVTWTQSSDTGPSGQYFYGTALLASAYDKDTVYVGGSGYSNPAVYRSTDGGQTFQPWDEGLPDTLVYCLAEAPDGTGTLFCGTETAAYRRELGSSTWIDITGNEAPVTTYWSAEAVAALGVIRFGTYGRGAWDYSLESDCLYAPYGLALGGANVATLDSASVTRLDATHTLELSDAPPSTGGYLLYSPLAANLPGLGGTLLVDPALMALIAIGTDGAGTATIDLPVPDDPLALDLPLHFQAALFDVSQPGGWAFSNGLQGVMCGP